MRVLLDTHAFLWWVTEHGARLSDRAREVIVDGDTEIAFSIASVWEIAIKAGAGRMVLPDAVERYLPDRLRHHAIELLAIELPHALRAGAAEAVGVYRREACDLPCSRRDYEDAVRNAISLGGDADTLACIAGGIAEAYYGGVPEEIARQALSPIFEGRVESGGMIVVVDAGSRAPPSS